MRVCFEICWEENHWQFINQLKQFYIWLESVLFLPSLHNLRVFLLQEYVVVKFVTSGLFYLVHCLKHMLLTSWLPQLKLGETQVALNVVFHEGICWVFIHWVEHFKCFFIFSFCFVEFLQIVQRRTEKVQCLYKN